MGLLGERGLKEEGRGRWRGGPIPWVWWWGRKALAVPTGIKGSKARLKHSPLLCSALLSSPPLTSASYLIGHPLTVICNSNENQTPALPTISTLCRSLPQQHGPKEKKGGREKSKWCESEWWRDPYQKRGYYVTGGLVDWTVRWPGKGRKNVLFHSGFNNGGLLTKWKDHSMMLAVALLRRPNQPCGRSNIQASVIPLYIWDMSE